MSQPLFDAREEVGNRIAQAPHLLLCMDYDGTLSHFVANPLGAVLSQNMERVLLKLAEHENISLAIVSGRDRNDLQARVGIPGLIYAGNHGLEISGPGFVFIEPTAAAHTETLQALAEELRGKLQLITGAFVEYKGLTISVHYRQVAEADWEMVRQLVHGTLANSSHPFVLTTGEKIYEIRPRVYWNKGSAVNWLRERLGRSEVLPIYVGDDVTDEDAFAAIPDGITIKVRDGSETAARYRLIGPTEVCKFLEWVDHLVRHRHSPLPVTA